MLSETLSPSPESVRLVNGTALCSGRVEVKASQSWSSVCKGDFDWQDAEVVCRELGCGAPLKLQLALHENIRALEWTKEFQCGGNESTLLDCESYESARNTCSPLGLTCSGEGVATSLICSVDQELWITSSAGGVCLV